MNSQKLRSAGEATKKRILNFSFYNRKFTFELVFYGKYITVYILFAVNILQFAVAFKSLNFNVHSKFLLHYCYIRLHSKQLTQYRL